MKVEGLCANISEQILAYFMMIKYTRKNGIEDINESKSSPDLSTSFAQQNRLEKFNNKDSSI